MIKKIIQTSKAPFPFGPYSQAVLSQGTLYVSGQIPINPETGEIVTKDIVAQTHQVMKNIQGILLAAQMDFGHIIKCSIFVTDLNNFAALNEAYEQYFSSDPPARETVQVSRLPKDAEVEISCIAVAQNDLDVA